MVSADRTCEPQVGALAVPQLHRGHRAGHPAVRIAAAIHRRRDAAIRQQPAGCMSIAQARPCRERRPIQAHRPRFVLRSTDTARPQQLHHQLRLIERRAGLIDQRAERALLQPIHESDFDVLAHVLEDALRIVVRRQRRRHLCRPQTPGQFHDLRRTNPVLSVVLNAQQAVRTGGARAVIGDGARRRHQRRLLNFDGR